MKTWCKYLASYGNALSVEMFCFKIPKLGAANIFLFPRLMSKYNILLPDVNNFIKMKIVLKGLLVVEKLRLRFHRIFSRFRDLLSSFVDPILMIPILTSKDMGMPSNGTEVKSTELDRSIVLNILMITFRLLRIQKEISNNMLLSIQ